MTHPTPQWPLRDHRSAAQIQLDKAAVQKQVNVLGSANGGVRIAPATVLESIRTRQQSGANTQPFVLLFPADGTGPVLVAENQLVIRADENQLATFGNTLLAGYPQRTQVRNKIWVMRSTNKGLQALRDDAKLLRDNNVMANLNVIMPLGYVVKGDAYPGSTTSLGAFPVADADDTVRVAIIDTGRTAENRNDAWFTGVVPNGTDPLNVLDPPDRNDWFAGHGTFTAGVVRQIAPRCEVVVYRFTKTDGVGTDSAAAEMLIKAADDAAGRRLIINASFGAPAVDGVPPLALQDAVEYVATRYPNTLMVASAGNDGIDQRLYPAAFSQFGVKAVGALNSDLSGAAFSNRGAWVHCSAVGVGVVSTFVQGKLPPQPNLGADIDFSANAWATWSGTSFTAPQISGAVASLCSATPTLQPRAAFDTLIAGRPKLDKFGAVVHLLRGTPVP